MTGRFWGVHRGEGLTRSLRALAEQLKLAHPSSAKDLPTTDPDAYFHALDCNLHTMVGDRFVRDEVQILDLKDETRVQYLASSPQLCFFVDIPKKKGRVRYLFLDCDLKQKQEAASRDVAEAEHGLELRRTGSAASHAAKHEPSKPRDHLSSTRPPDPPLSREETRVAHERIAAAIRSAPGARQRQGPRRGAAPARRRGSARARRARGTDGRFCFTNRSDSKAHASLTAALDALGEMGTLSASHELYAVATLPSRYTKRRNEARAVLERVAGRAGISVDDLIAQSVPRPPSRRADIPTPRRPRAAARPAFGANGRSRRTRSASWWSARSRPKHSPERARVLCTRTARANTPS